MAFSRSASSTDFEHNEERPASSVVQVANDASRNTNKRRRLVPDKADNRVEEDSWALSPPHHLPTMPVRGAQTVLEHKPGSIVRISMKNFVTYTLATFHPGPALNMIIGPNGTGKSTLVCAICLGLGWGPQHLGRAKEPGEFVKHGASEAAIEIELKGQQGRINDVIGRKIKRDGGKSTWSHNGITTNLKRVQEITSSFNIQVDNLCQFLPQDRVVEFANLRPEELLTSTLRATGNALMIQQHEQLKGLRQEQKQQELDLKNNKGMLENLEKRQQVQAADVERIKERADVLQNIKYFKETRIFSEFYKAKFDADAGKDAWQTLSDEVEDLRKDSEPVMRRIDEKRHYGNQIEAFAKAKKVLFDRTLLQLESYEEERKAFAEKINDCVMKRDIARKTEKAKRSETKQIERSLAHLKNIAGTASPTFSPAEFNERIRETKREIAALNNKIASLNTDDTRQQIKERQDLVNTHEREISNLHSQAGQQEMKLRTASKDSADAWAWIQNHKDEFTGPIYGPPIIECSVKDKRFVNQVESILQRGDFCAITCTNKEDMDRLRRQIFTTMKLADVSIRVSRKKLSEIPSPVDEGEMRRLGIEGWVLNYIAGPEPVLSMLCAEQRIHATGIIPRDVNDTEFASLQESQVSSFVSDKQIYTVKRRRDLGMNSTATKRILPAKYWTEQGVDDGAERDLLAKVKETKAEISQLQDAVNSSKQKISDLKNQCEKLEGDVTSIQNEKNAKQKAQVEYDLLPSRIDEEHEKLKKCRESESLSRLDAAEWDRCRTNFQIKRGQRAIDITNFLISLRATYADLIKANISLLEARSDQESLEQKSSTIVQNIKEKEEAYKVAGESYREARENAKKLKHKVVKLNGTNPDLFIWFNELPKEKRERSPQAVDDEISALEARLGLILVYNPEIIQEFESRASKIAELKGNISESESSLSSVEQSISAIRARWEPEVDAIVSEISSGFSEYFKHMGDSGYVEVHKAGDNGREFDEWSIGIHVKFRSEENMSILDSHRQSGGERAVTTVSYLMALQQLSKAPFRVVDEINQGMDPKNERRVHGLLVDISNSSGDASSMSSQYFLITPKLLTGLEYSESMKVHCIVSGEHVPDNPTLLDFGEILRSRKQQISQLQNGSSRLSLSAAVSA